ncbi:hypothetical protein GCM10010112_20280 [Actinoplanes lobatus]|uniref:Uncharacterized protein n=1 Tax=Actinoplanes lobatus TaxID=113568 RepID=A0ABQ4AZP9_9ACTN|nr:hypothetical protein GCM10010112_20280 [Actinoplanes lobatus]GIE46049.1 hypothetical protein Alo02nite_89470 [Actinoplanes lobatus]
MSVMVIVTGCGPQSKVIRPPAATAFTTAAEVQLAGVPLPIVRSGRLVSTARAVAGTVAFPPGLPGFGSVFGLALGFGGTGVGTEADEAGGAAAELAATAGANGRSELWHAASEPAAHTARMIRPQRIGRCYGFPPAT